MLSEKKLWQPYLLFWSLLYFFLNTAGLPEGLLYTGLLTPVLLYWLYREKALKPVIYFMFFTLLFVPFHLRGGVDARAYLRSWLLLISTAVFTHSLYHYLKAKPDLRGLFRGVLLINFLLAVTALLLVSIPWVRDNLWYLKELSPGAGTIPRLKMLTYEASYYALLFVPITLYFYLRILLAAAGHPFTLWLMALFPLALSLSFGVIAAVALTLVFIACFDQGRFIGTRQLLTFIALPALAGLAGWGILSLYNPHNPMIGRIGNIFQGKDTSFRGRTYEAFVLASRIAHQKSILFGCGPGQTKIVGISVFKNYYGYLPPVVRIPNTLADVLAAYGITGCAIRLLVPVYLFFRWRVHRNYYQLALFVFMFIYQFTGSFMTNIVEYATWVLAFTPVFGEFDRDYLKGLRAAPAPHRMSTAYEIS